MDLIRLYILHRAAMEPVFSLGMTEKLDRHGLKLSTGSVSQILRGLERKGYLVATTASNGRQRQKLYRATRRGRVAIEQAEDGIRELLAE
jgi:DNA-binding PadR family transcriptional regulator